MEYSEEIGKLEKELKELKEVLETTNRPKSGLQKRSESILIKEDSSISYDQDFELNRKEGYESPSLVSTPLYTSIWIIYNEHSIYSYI